MGKCKKGLALLLMLLLLVSTLSAVTLGDDGGANESTGTGGESTGTVSESTGTVNESTGTGGESTGTGSESTETVSESAETGGESTGTGGESTGTGGESTETGSTNTETGGGDGSPQAEELPAEVIYNLLDQEITVGGDAAQAEARPGAYQLFNEDGSYSIKLKDDAFFPFEVQFQYGGAVFTEWFDTPESIVQVGEHAFSVWSEQTGPAKIRQIGIWVGGDYLAARPAPKTFTNPMFKSYSMGQLPEVNLVLPTELLNYTPPELRMVGLDVILSGQDVADGSSVVWVKKGDGGDDSYTVASKDDKIDLSPRNWAGETSFRLELIVGDAMQLNPENTRYNVSGQVRSSQEWLDFSVYREVEGTREAVAHFSEQYETYGEPPSYRMYADAEELRWGEDIWLSMKWSAGFAGLAADKTVEIWRGLYETEVELAAADPADDITARIWNVADMSLPDSGYTADFGDYYNQPEVTLVMRAEGEVVGMAPFTLYVGRMGTVPVIRGMYESAASNNSVNSGGWNESTQAGIRTIRYFLRDYPVDAEYHLRMALQFQGTTDWANNQHVAAAVTGHVDTKEGIEALIAGDTSKNIKALLFPETNAGGYPANYSGNGQDFTVLDAEDRIYKIRVRAEAAEQPENVPEPGSSDTYFQVQGAAELNQTYILPSEHDTYYSVGYQTVFYLDDVAPEVLTPIFWKGNKVDVYAGTNEEHGAPQESAVTERDFSDGPVQYAAAAEDGAALRNYWVTFVPKYTEGPKLFVNGINGGDIDETTGYPKREVFLTDITSYSNYHDIFIANVGSAELTGLTASLEEGAQNIALDAYWTVGGENNSTLAAFETTEKDWANAPNGELPNVAKIRIAATGEGEISGTLRISAEGQEDIVIALTGNAGNPKLTTEDIPEAVKFVPYAVQILHNNKYSWNTVTMSMNGGSLPEGVVLKANGELYGAPRQTGTFTFGVRMDNSDDRFSDSTAQYTLTVLENTNQNVADATDTGYEVTTFVGTQEAGGAYADYVVSAFRDYDFVSDGEFGEFDIETDVFRFNGEILARGVDYTAEDGSTRITILRQTFESKGVRNGVNTIAAEFRIGGDEENELRRAAQNFVIRVGGSSGSPGGPSEGSDWSGGSSGGSGGSGGSGTQAAPPQTPAPGTGAGDQASTPFDDVRVSDWHYAVVTWANENGYMVGVGERTFNPNAEISDATVAAVLARLAKADLTPYAGTVTEGIAAGEWYSQAASWAKATGLFGDALFSAAPPTSRGELALMLDRFIKNLGIESVTTAEYIQFADAAEMTEEENMAFQTLNKLGVFYGKGGNAMDPRGNTSRAELAALLHRLQTLIEQ